MSSESLGTDFSALLGAVDNDARSSDQDVSVLQGVNKYLRSLYSGALKWGENARWGFSTTPSTMSATAARSLRTCVFCKIVKGEMPSFKIAETDLSYAFVPLPPLTNGHTLVVPKDHAAKMHEVPDEYLADALALAKKIVLDYKLENYNIIQNNGRIAYQTVDHVHFHVIPKPDKLTGLLVDWGEQKSPEELERYREELFAKRHATGKTT